MRTVIAVTTTFSAAHRLPEHEGKCYRLHGHTYTLEVAVAGDPQDSGPAAGMVMDFADLREQVEGLVAASLDHRLLNEVLPFVPTVEKLAAWVFEKLRETGIPVVRVRLAEGPHTYVEVSD